MIPVLRIQWDHEKSRDLRYVASFLPVRFYYYDTEWFVVKQLLRSTGMNSCLKLISGEFKWVIMNEQMFTLEYR